MVMPLDPERRPVTPFSTPPARFDYSKGTGNDIGYSQAVSNNNLPEYDMVNTWEQQMDSVSRSGSGWTIPDPLKRSVVGEEGSTSMPGVPTVA